jgi:hypothetical protein
VPGPPGGEVKETMTVRKILMAVLVLSLFAIMTYGAVASAAWFSDTDHVAVTATSGGIDITGNPTTMTVDDLMPGVYSDPQEFDIYNTGNSTVPVKFRVTDQMLSGTDSGFYSKIQVKVNPWNCGAAGPEEATVYEGLLKNLDFNNSQQTLFHDGLPVNWTACFHIRFELVPSTSNAYQNQSANFNLVMEGTQLENPGW